ncbi:G3ST1-like protein [Mya arenaria]|uniref:G3ST1-like protein n=1 Tax=Mya arenaria TaxID=6604 RepID=A0ABY7DI05_MYAAR|nr:galactosylceramide sulfotransferase-like [Mya arenaria]WAQ97317.1 G3ST1-like protein [Mya arenaria]
MSLNNNSIRTLIGSVGVVMLVLTVMSVSVMHREFFTSATKPEQLLDSLNIRKEYTIKTDGLTRNEGAKPTPVTHVGFLKVHKAASTTTQAIFLRFGWRRNLTFVLPFEYNNCGYPNVISTNESVTKYNTIMAGNGTQFDILCHHVLYGDREWSSVLHTDSFLVGTVREPFSHFKSILNYFRPLIMRQLKNESPDPVAKFLNSPKEFDAKDPRYSLLNNRMAIEYGVDPEIVKSRDVRKFNEYLHNVLDRKFSVVIPAKRFDEGLILMKRRLNWALNDIMYAMKNVRGEKEEVAFPVSENLRELYEEHSLFDYMIYDFFLAKFQRQVEAEGQSFARETEHFKQVRKEVEEFCHNRSEESRTEIIIPESEFNEKFIMDRSDCKIMHMGEIEFTQEIRKRQYGSADWTQDKQIEWRRKQNQHTA